jgi:hypothetical protein
MHTILLLECSGRWCPFQVSSEHVHFNLLVDVIVKTWYQAA